MFYKGTRLLDKGLFICKLHKFNNVFFLLLFNIRPVTNNIIGPNTMYFKNNSEVRKYKLNGSDQMVVIIKNFGLLITLKNKASRRGITNIDVTI
jgi:hypothetical protein